MSSILDALEKAEGERIRGAASASGLGPAQRKRSGRRFNLPLIAGIVVGLLLLNLALWWFYLRVESVNPAPVSTATSGVLKPTPAEVSRAEPKPRPQPKPVLVQAPVKPALSLRDQLKRNTAPSDKPLIEEAQVTQKPVPPPAPAPVVRSASSAEPPRPERVAAKPPAQEMNRVVGASDRVPLALSRAAAEAPPAPVEQPPQEQIPLVWELPQTLREKVLQLKSSVHVYNETPAQRFVIINMHRYSEGDALPPDGFLLQRIDRDGVVIDYGAGQVRLPRR
jgi:general secretion pathway protein B